MGIQKDKSIISRCLIDNLGKANTDFLSSFCLLGILGGDWMISFKYFCVERPILRPSLSVACWTGNPSEMQYLEKTSASLCSMNGCVHLCVLERLAKYNESFFNCSNEIIASMFSRVYRCADDATQRRGQ